MKSLREQPACWRPEIPGECDSLTRLIYRDFDLLIEGGGGGYRARVLASPGGDSTRAQSFVLPFSDLALENFLLRVGARRRGIRSSMVAEMSKALSVFGGQLFEAVFQGEIADCLFRSLGLVYAQDNSGLRIKLHLTDCPELANLPWEYIYDPQRRRYLCLSERTPLIRYLSVSEPVRPLRVNGPLRILVVASGPTLEGAGRLEVESEWDNLLSAIRPSINAGVVHVDRLARPTLVALHRQLRQGPYHVLHFIGHGRFNVSDDQGELLFEDERGFAHPVRAVELATVLHDHHSLRLVVLNSCEGARSGIVDPFAGTAQVLLQQGAPAVVAMQFEISDTAAIAFSEGLYAALAAGDSLDAAVVDARKAIFARGNQVEWATPVLCTRAPDTQIFEITTPATLAPESGGIRENEAAPKRMHVVGVRVEVSSNQPILLLREVNGGRYVPIWIGSAEAVQVVSAQKGSKPEVPLTHDLFCNVLDALDISLERASIVSLRDGVFAASIVLNGKEFQARPSDAATLSLMTAAPLFASEEVLGEAGHVLPDPDHVN